MARNSAEIRTPSRRRSESSNEDQITQQRQSSMESRTKAFTRCVLLFKNRRYFEVEWIAKIRTKTAKAMQRSDVRRNYEKRMRVCLAMHRATNNKIKAKKEEAKAEELKRLRESMDPEEVQKKKELINERRRRRRRELAAERRQQRDEKPKKQPTGPGSRKPLSVEQKRKISESVRKRWSDPNYRYRVSESMRLKRAEANASL